MAARKDPLHPWGLGSAPVEAGIGVWPEPPPQGRSITTEGGKRRKKDRKGDHMVDLTLGVKVCSRNEDEISWLQVFLTGNSNGKGVILIRLVPGTNREAKILG